MMMTSEILFIREPGGHRINSCGLLQTQKCQLTRIAQSSQTATQTAISCQSPGRMMDEIKDRLKLPLHFGRPSDGGD